MREIKFRAWHIKTSQMYTNTQSISDIYKNEAGTNAEDVIFLQFTGLHDKNGNEIYEGDILQFSDKWEWYRCQYGPKFLFADEAETKALLEQLEKEPYERRLIEIPSSYEWLLSSEIQHEWEIIGNIHENPELLEPPNTESKE